MIIVLDNSSTSLSLRQPITGKVKVFLKEPFEAKALTMGLRGILRSHFMAEVPGDQFGKTGEMTTSAKSVITERFTVAEFDPNSVLSGASEYSFSLELPEVVKESLMLQFNENNISLTHYLTAQMEPRNTADYANLNDKISTLRTDYALYMYRPAQHSEEEQKLGNPAGSINNLTQKLINKIGGIAGLGASEATSTITLDKETFAPGEKIQVHIDMDNTKCKKPVKSFKVKMKRVVECLSGKKGVGKPLLREEDYIIALKFDGCAELIRDTRTIEFQVPQNDKKFGNVDNLHPELRHMAKMFTDSVSTVLFKVEYVLDVFVKHQSKLEFGMGNSVSFPITVSSQEQNLPWVSTKEQTWLMAQDLTAWEPTVSYPMVYLRCDKNPDDTLTPVSSWSSSIVPVAHEPVPVVEHHNPDAENIAAA